MIKDSVSIASVSAMHDQIAKVIDQSVKLWKTKMVKKMPYKKDQKGGWSLTFWLLRWL